MSLLRKAKDSSRNVYKDQALIGILSEHLRQMGIDAALLPPESPEAVGPRWKKGPFASGQSLGCVKIGNRNLNLIQIEKAMIEEPPHTGGPDGPGEAIDLGRLVYLFHFVVRVDVEGLEGALKAEIKPITKGFLSKKTTGFKWEGRELARRLNLDSLLESMLLKKGLNELPIIEVRADKANKCVRITRKPPIPEWTISPRSRGEAAAIRNVGRDFPTLEEFQTYDRIAHHIRSMHKGSALITK